MINHSFVISRKFRYLNNNDTHLSEVLFKKNQVKFLGQKIIRIFCAIINFRTSFGQDRQSLIIVIEQILNITSSEYPIFTSYDKK